MDPSEVVSSTLSCCPVVIRKLKRPEYPGAGYYHGTIIRTGITCKKIPCYMRDSAYRWFIVKKAKIF